MIGPNADDAEVLLGNYNGEPSAPVTPLAGIRRKLAGAHEVLYARGSDLAANLPAFETGPFLGAVYFERSPTAAAASTASITHSANFDGKPHRPRELTYPSSGKMVGSVPARSQAAVHAHRSAGRLPLVGRRAARPT